MENNAIMGISKNLQLRLLSALCLIPCLITVIHHGGLVFHCVILLAYVGMIYELVRMTKEKAKGIKIMANFGGILYISFACYSLYHVREVFGKNLLLWLLLIVWSSDSVAYIAGKTFKGPKACPSISPNKTWSGMVGGIVGAVIVGYISALYFFPEIQKSSKFFYTGSSLILSITCHFGDLVESGFKRWCGVKESGAIIPGHGGLLDRLDGLLLVAIVVGFSLMIKFYP